MVGGGTGDDNKIVSPAQAHVAGRTLVALFEWNAWSYPLISIVDTAGNTWIQAVWFIGDESSRYGIYYATNIIGHPANVVTVTIDGVIGFRCLVVEEFEGLALPGPLNGIASGSDYGTVMATDTPLPVEAGSVITALAMGFGNPMTGGAGYTAFTPIAGTPYFLDEYKLNVNVPELATASQATVNYWTLVAASFRAFSSATGSVTGEYVPPRTAVLTQTLAGATLIATALRERTGTVTQSLASATVSATGELGRLGTLTQALAPATLTATALHGRTSTLAELLQAAVLDAIATSELRAVLARTLQSVTVSALSTLETQAALSRLLASTTVVSDTDTVPAGVLMQTLAPASLVADIGAGGQSTTFMWLT